MTAPPPHHSGQRPGSDPSDDLDALAASGPFSRRFLEPVRTRVRPRTSTGTLVVDAGDGTFGRSIAGLESASGAGDGPVVVAFRTDRPADADARTDVELDRGIEHHPNRAPVDLRHDASDRLPLSERELGTFGSAIVPGLLGRVTDPVSELERLRPAMAPDARVLIIEDDRPGVRLHPPCPHFETAWRWMLRRRAEAGSDPAVAVRAPAVLRRAGFIAERTGTLELGGLVRSDAGRAALEVALGLAASGRTIAGSLRPDESATGGNDFAHAMAAVRTWERDPDATIWWPARWIEASLEPH